jgi:hypothetical protein
METLLVNQGDLSIFLRRHVISRLGTYLQSTRDFSQVNGGIVSSTRGTCLKFQRDLSQVNKINVSCSQMNNSCLWEIRIKSSGTSLKSPVNLS